MNQYCYKCHDEDVQKGDVQLDKMDSLSLEAKLDLLNSIQEQIYIGEMPPRKKKQPLEKERLEILDLIASELKNQNASKFEDTAS